MPRKLLMEVELPSETQQIDRVLQAFAERYHECNPFVYKDPGRVTFLATLQFDHGLTVRRSSILHSVFADHAPHRFLQQEQ